MRLTNDAWLRIARSMLFCLAAIGLVISANGQAVITTTVQGTVYLANGQPGGGTLTVSWPTFTTAAGQLVAADLTTVAIGNDGFVSINLAPNQGATPAGQFYTAVFYMGDGTVNTQYWIVPAAAQATLAQIQAQVMPAAQAVQAVSKAYVDQSISELSQSLLTASGGNLTGPLFLNGDPTQPLQAADKHYVDLQVATAVPLSGGNMVGPLSTPEVNGVESPTVNSPQTSLQAAMNAAGTNGAMEIPPTYAGVDTFTNPNGIRVTDLRTSVAQQIERSVKEFGAVCDGVTDDTNALQSAINYAQAHGVALSIPEGTCKTRTLNWHGESIGGLGKQVSALMGFPGQDVLATTPDNPNILSYTRLNDFTIYVDQSQDVSCSQAEGRATAGSCQLNRPMENNTIFSPGGNGLRGTAGSGAGWAVGNCAIAMQAATGAGGNGLKNAQIENVEIVETGTDPMAAQYPGAHSTHTCGLYLAQWPQWSEFKNIDIRGLNTGVAIPALPGTTPAGLLADSNRWQNITIQATHGFTATAGCNGILDDVTALARNSAASGEPPTGIILDLQNSQEGWTVRNAVVMPNWTAVQPALTVTAAGGAVSGVTAGTEHGLGWDPYGTTVPLAFSGSCTAQANAAVNNDGSIGAISVTQGGSGCSSTTTASINAPGNWDTAAPVNLIGGQNMTFFAGSLLRGNGGYTVWNATGAQSYGTQVNGGGGNLPGGGSYPAFIANNSVGSTFQVDQFPGANFGAKLQTCVNAVNSSYGGTCDARNFTGSQTMSANVTISSPNTTVLLPCATIATANQLMITAGTRNVALRGCAMRGGSAASGSQGGTAFEFSGTGAVVQVGDPTYAVDTQGFHMDNSVINTTGSTSATAQGLVAYRTQEIDLEDMYLLGNSNQTGVTLDGTGNYAGGTIRGVQISGFKTAVNAIGHQVVNPATTDWMNASTFVRLHIDCPTNSGSPIAGTIGVNLQQGDGNTFTGGDVEGCSTALHLGANAQNNTIIGLRNENSTNQVVADAGSSYNNWITGGTMFTGQLTDNGTRNSFQDTFHRSFNGINGDWYGSQQDATVTNHFRLGIGAGNERGLLNEYQTDYGYRWTEGLSDATGGEQFYQILDQLNNVYRISIGQYNNGQSSTNNQTVVNSAGTGAVVLNGTTNSGTGGVIIGSGGSNPGTVATINSSGNAQFIGTLLVGGTSQSAGTMTVRNNADAEVDYYLWPGLTTSQKGSFTYKDWNGNSQWYMVKDSSNNWALNSALGGLDSFKAYQSTNSGDTYIDASNSSGHIRLNYETGSGAETDIYSGSSANLVASFLGPTAVKLPGLAAGSGHNCLQIDNSGYITNTGAACGSGGGSGTVNSGNSGQIAYYTGNGTTVGGVSSVPVSAGGTGASSASTALTNLGALPMAGGTMTGVLNGTSVTGAINGGLATQTALAGLKQDMRLCQDITATSGLNTISSTSCAQFTAADVGKVILIYPSGSGRAFTGTIYSVQSSTGATLSGNYQGATTGGNATATIGTDDGGAFNAYINLAIASKSAKGPLSLGCKPIITTLTLLISGGRNTSVEGCGLASGTANGTTIIWAGASTPVTLTESGNTATLTASAGHGFYGAGNQCAVAYKQCFVDVEGATQAPYNGMHLIQSVSSSTVLTYYVATTGLSSDSGYMPINDVIELKNDEGVTIKDINILGSDQASSKPRALIDLTDTSAGPYPNSLNAIENVTGGNIGTAGFGYSFPGNAAANTATAQFGILADPADWQNDRNQVQNVHFYNVNGCFVAEHSQPQDWTFTGTIGCYFSGVSFALTNGNWWHISGTLENLQDGLDFFIGNNSHLDVAKYNEETDGPATVNAPQVGGPADVAGTTMFAEFVSPAGGGVPAGTLAIDHGVYPASSAVLPSNGDIIWGNAAGIVVNLNDFTLTYGNDLSATVYPIVDFSMATGGAKNVFNCHGCSGFQTYNFNVTTTGTAAQMTVIKNDAPAGPGLGESGENWLQNGDVAGVDDFRRDIPGKLRVLGGYVNVAQITSPSYAYGFSCNASGSTTYYYKITSISGGLESPPIGEYPPGGLSGCAGTVSSANYITGYFYPVVGADGYKVYRGTTSGNEGLVLTLPANTGYNTSEYTGAGHIYNFKDTAATPGAAPPSVNASGLLQSYFYKSWLATAPTGSCPVSGFWTLTQDGNLTICKSGTWTAYNAPTATSATQINGGAIPASANGLSTNSSSQPVASTAHNQSLIAGCTTTNSGNAYSCSTAPTFTPAAGDQLLVDFNAANTGSATLNVNSAGAVTLYKWGNTATLAGGDLQAGHYIRATYDGSHWQLEGQLGNANATQVNGASVPASAAVLGSNSSSQPIAATPHQLAAVLQCADTSFSPTTYACTTSPTISSLTKGDTIIFTSINQNNSAGAVTLNIDGIGAKTVTKWQNSSTTLATGDLQANASILLTYDGTYLEADTVGNAPGASSGAINSAGAGYFISTGLETMMGLAVSAAAPASANAVYVCQFTMNNTWTIGHAAFYVATGASSSSANAGIYSSSGNRLIDTGPVSTTSNSTSVSASFTDVTEPAGIYYFAFAGTSASVTFESLSDGASSIANGTINKVSTKCGSAANLLSGGNLPSTLGTITAASPYIPVVAWEY